MKIDQHKLRELMAREHHVPSPDELRREDGVFFVGGDLPERDTLETLFDSFFQCHATLFHLTFGAVDSFQSGETLARMIKKNFNAHLLGRIDFAPPAQLIERAYAAGVDILDLPLSIFDEAHPEVQERLAAIDRARSVFPRWSVASTLTVAGESAAPTIAAIDALLAREVVPLVTLPKAPCALPAEEVARIFSHLNSAWRQKKALVKPLLPLIHLSTPIVPASPRGRMRGFIDIIDGRRLLATSDLRRILRVKEVEESFSSSGL